jgi:hypothetical protein
MQTDTAIKPVDSPSSSVLLRLCAWISGVLAVVGLVFIVIFYSGISIFGPLNDAAFTLQLIFTVPIMIQLTSRVEPPSPVSRRALQLTGVLGFVGAISLQLLLIIGVLTFFQMIGPLLAFIALIVVWFVLIERWRGDEGSVPQGWLLAILAGLTFGYPVWAYRYQRSLARGSSGPTATDQKGE